MRKFSIEIFGYLDISYNHYLSTEFIMGSYFNGNYPLDYYSRKFDKPAWKFTDGTCVWYLDHKRHKVGRPAWICFDGSVAYYENGWRMK